MNHFDDELRRTLTDDRLSLVASGDAVERVVRGARRRRYRRTAATAVASVAAVAALAVGSVAVAGQFRAVEPADTQPAGTLGPTGVATELPRPGQTTRPQTPPESVESPDAGETDNRPVLGPYGLGPIRLGMTLDELEAVEGIVIETPSWAGDTCYGQYRLGSTSGFISQRHDFGGTIVDTEFQVTSIGSDAPVRTPEGVAEGATFAEVKAAYPDLEAGPFDGFVAVPGNPGARWYLQSFGSETDVLTDFVLDGGQNCAG